MAPRERSLVRRKPIPGTPKNAYMNEKTSKKIQDRITFVLIEITKYSGKLTKWASSQKCTDTIIKEIRDIGS